MVKKRNAFIIHGRVVGKETGQGIPDLKVKAFDKDLFFDDLLGEVTTDKEGNFEIVYDKSDFRELFFDNRPDLYIMVKTPEGEEIYSSKNKVRYGADKVEDFTIPIPADIYFYPKKEFTVSVLRPEDMLSLDFKFINVRISGKQLLAFNKNLPAYMVVEFPPQNIAEEAFFEVDKTNNKDNFPITNDKDPDKGQSGDENPYSPCKSRISENSRLVFIIPKDKKISYNSEGILKACTELDLKVAPTASPPQALLFADIKYHDLLQKVDMLKHVDQSKLSLQKKDNLVAGKDLFIDTDPANTALETEAQKWVARSTMANYLPRAYDDELRVKVADDYWKGKLQLKMPELKKPTDLETSIEAPFRLIISPNHYAAWAHAPLSVKSSLSKRYELWHTRYALRINDKVVEDDHRLRTIRAIWMRDIGFDADNHTKKPDHYNPGVFDDNLFRMSLDGYDRHNIVHLTSNHYIPPYTENNITKKYTPTPADVNRLMLTSLGAWMNIRGFWDPDKGTDLSVEEWKHRGTMGRDHYVKVVYKGYLYPFGHKASLVKVTERKFHPQIMIMMIGNKQVFKKKMDDYVGELKMNYRPEASSAMCEINKAFEKEIYTLLGNIDGKSENQVSKLISESKKRFGNETVAAFNAATDKRNMEFDSLTEHANLEYESSINDIIKNLVPWKYPNVAGNIAYLRQRMYIIVRQPEKIYVNNTGLTTQRSYDLQFPFWSAQITTLVTPDLNPPEQDDILGNGQALFWPCVGSDRFKFHFILKDYAGHEIEFNAPLIFIEQPILNYFKNNGNSNEDNYKKVITDYLNEIKNAYEGENGPNTSGQPVMFADSAHDPGKATLDTNSIKFSAEIPAELSQYEKLQKNIVDFESPQYYPIIKEANVIIPSIKHLAGNDNSVDIKYNAYYLKHDFSAQKNKGEVFLDLINVSKLDFNSQGDRSGGLVKPNLGISGFSKLMGPVAGTNLTGLAEGNFDPSDFFGALDAKIFGVISLMDIIQSVNALDFSNKTKNFPKITTDTSSDKLIAELKWEPELKDWENLFIASNDGTNASLMINGKMTVQSSGKSDIDITCTLTNFSLDLLGNFESFLLIRFVDVVFKSQGGKKADVDVNIAGIEFIGVLAFVEKLKEFIPLDGFCDPPSLEVTEKGIKAGFSLGIPDIAVGVFSLENISLGASFTIPFTDEPLSVRFNFCDRHEQFLLTVSCFGGGGFFAITLDPGGIQRLEAAFEFGAKLSVNFGVASGGVYVMAGIYFEMKMDPEKAALTGYFRMGGEVSVLGIISVSIELYLELRYEFTSGKCVGKATLTIEVEIIFFSISVEISCEKKFAGSDGDPSFEQLMEKYPHPKTNIEVDPWKEYCEAYA